jgi:hypothetical protein
MNSARSRRLRGLSTRRSNTRSWHGRRLNRLAEGTHLDAQNCGIKVWRPCDPGGPQRRPSTPVARRGTCLNTRGETSLSWKTDGYGIYSGGNPKGLPRPDACDEPMSATPLTYMVAAAARLEHRGDKRGPNATPFSSMFRTASTYSTFRYGTGNRAGGSAVSQHHASDDRRRRSW